MPSFAITGVARGLGWEFLRRLSSDANNTVVGIVRNKAATENRVVEELNGRANVFIVEADITDYYALKKAAAETAAIIGGALDCLIANAAYLPTGQAFNGLGELGADPVELSKQFHKVMDTNVLANIHLYNLFMPYILNGKAKKVVAITSMVSDVDLVRNYDLAASGPYSASKAAMNMITAQFSAEYRERGVLFLSICPGSVDTGYFKDATPEQQNRMGNLIAKFQNYAPGFTQPATPQDAAESVLSVINSCSVEGGHGGASLSHLGNKQWL